MNLKKLCVSFCMAGFLTMAASLTMAQDAKDPKPKDAKPAAKDAKPAQDPKAGAPSQGEMKLPPGWTEADMQACMIAGTPGKNHEHLAKDVGTWAGKTTMWMAPGAEPAKSDCTAKFSKVMDGRFIRCEITGEMPGMGPFNGFGIYGFDNVTQKFVASWIDNCGTGIMNGTGELSSDGKTITWTYNYTCPITKKPTTMREVDKTTGPDTKTVEMFGTDPKSGKEYKMMVIEYTRKPAAQG